MPPVPKLSTKESTSPPSFQPKTCIEYIIIRTISTHAHVDYASALSIVNVPGFALSLYLINHESMKERMGEKGIDKYAAELGKWTFRTNGPCLSIPAQGSQVSCF